MKTCSRCKQELPLTEFALRSARRADGSQRPQSMCKACFREYRNAWTKRNRDLANEYKRRHRETHGEEIREAKRRLYKTSEKIRSYNARWRAANLEHARQREKRYAQTSRWNAVLRDHGLTQGSYGFLYQSQNGRCAICKVALPPGRISRAEMLDGAPVAHVDHCHKTDVIRGLLCGECNRGIGLLRDDPVRALAAYEYLSRTPPPIERVPPADRRRSSGTLSTHCSQGHPFTETNTYLTPQGARVCRTCRREKAREKAREKHPDALERPWQRKPPLA